MLMSDSALWRRGHRGRIFIVREELAVRYYLAGIRCWFSVPVEGTGLFHAAGFLMPKITRSAAILCAFVGCSWTADVWAADMPVKAPPASADSTPKPCTSFEDFITTNCQLTWHGITVYGTI